MRWKDGGETRMAFLDRNRINNQYNKNGDKMITLRLSIENSLRFMTYVTISNPLIRKKNINNLQRLLDLVNPDISYTDEEVEGKQYFMVLRIITGMVNRDEVSELQVLSDHLVAEHGDKDIPVEVIHNSIDAIGQAIDGEFVLGENEILEMNKFVEARLNYSFLNENLEELNDLTRELAEGRISNTKVVNNADKLISSLYTSITKTKTASNIEDNTINFLDRETSSDTIGRHVDKLRSPENKLKTGYKALNRMINGGFQEGRLYAFLGTPKSFKSGTLLNLALSVAKHNEVDTSNMFGRKPVVIYYSMENDSIETLDRIFFYHFGRSISDTDKSLEEVKEDIFNATMYESGVGLVVKYAPSMSVDTNHLYDTISELREDGYETIMMVQDYLRRIRPVKQDLENRLALGNVADELSVLAKTESIPVLTASQLNREATNIREHAIKQGIMDIASQMFVSHIAESVQIQQNIDYGIIVAREEVIKYDVDGDKTTDSYLGVKLVASRDRQQEDGGGNKLEYFALPFENGFKLAEDEGTNEDRWFESVARGSMTDEEYADMEARKEKIQERMNTNYRSRTVGDQHQSAPNLRATNRTSIGRSSELMNRTKIREKIRSYSDPENDIP